MSLPNCRGCEDEFDCACEYQEQGAYLVQSDITNNQR